MSDEEDLPTLPDNYVGAWLTKSQLKARNKELAKLGKRICKTHQGAALPLDAEHFRYADDTHKWFMQECRRCELDGHAKFQREKYVRDEKYRTEQRSRAVQWAAKNPKKHSEKVQRSKRKQRREKFAQIIGRAS